MRSQSEQRKPRRQTEPMMVWVKPAIRREYERIAQQKGLSLSRTGAAALEGWLAQETYMRYDTLIQAAIDQAITKGMRAQVHRLAILLVRSLFTSEQTRALTVNLLGQQSGMTQPTLDKILDGTSDTARRNIKQIKPQLAAAVADIEKWLSQQTA